MKELDYIARLSDVVPRLPELCFAHPVSWTIRPGEHWAVIGPNGAGKTLLADFLQRKHALKTGKVEFGYAGGVETTVKSIAFKDIYSLADARNSYYQQRWHSSEAGESALVSDLLGEAAGQKDASSILACFNFEEQLNKRLIFLSSGELRKLLILRALLSTPNLLILDNPFIGLDAESRALLLQLLREIIAAGRTQIVLLLSDPSDIPAMITHVLPVRDRQCLTPVLYGQFGINGLAPELFPEKNQLPTLPLPVNGVADHEVTLRMERVTIRYGNRTILSGLDWEVKNGEKWSLSGVNGAGKSTLLSLVYADNPQSYANTFYLFDKKRGTGESIWEIKRKIGYVSPEMHRAYLEDVPVRQVVGSGFFDSVGLYGKCSEEQLEAAVKWMQVFAIGHLQERRFLSLSFGEQRLALLARAFVKSPDLLVLDEPLHGLDASNKRYVTRLIERYCSLPGKTLIFVTHYPEELPPCVDKHFILKKNK